MPLDAHWYSHMEIVPGTTDDASTVANLWVSLAEEQTDYGSRVDPASNRASVREAASHHAVAGGLLVARDGDAGTDGDVVGFVMFHVEDENGGGRRGVVENLYVVPGFRNRGIGGRLLAGAERRLTHRGAEFVSLEAMADNEDARRFYRREGYDPHRVRLEKPLESDNLSKDGG
jgi:ribosomal protein S18 acetylase RimI-like enzyme